MPQEAIPFGPNQQSGLDPLSSSVQLAVNVVIDQSGAVRRRPGISPYDGAPITPVDPDGIDGVHVTVGGKVYLAGGSAPLRKLYRVVGGVAYALSDGVQGELVGDGRPIFAETEAMVAIAAGGAPQKILLVDDSSSRLGGGPPAATHIIANSSRLLVNRLISERNFVNYSDVAAGSSIAGHETWNSGDAGSFNAGSRPDPVLALAENGEEIFMFGSTILQAAAPAEVDVYGTTAFREFGCIAPYSVVKFDDRFIWLDQRRRFIQSNGRETNVISGPIQKTLDELEDVTDAFGFRMVLGPVDVVVWTFPTHGQSFAFASGFWSQWSGWSEIAATFAKLGIQSAAAHPLTGETILGMADGRVCVLDHRTHTDLGETIPVRVFTGFLNRSTDSIKHCLSVRLVFRRGSVQSGPEPTAILAWRDDEDEWSPGIEVGLGDPGDRNPVVLLRSLGTYRRRQWRIDFDGNSEFALASANEEFEVEEE